MNLPDFKTGLLPVLFTAPWVYGTNLYIELLQKSIKEEIVQVNIDTDPEFADKYNVIVLPTLLFLKSGEEFLRFAGFNEISSIVKNYSKVRK
jgi:thiol-disulfide isomerase/thioredoxin